MKLLTILSVASLLAAAPAFADSAIMKRSTTNDATGTTVETEVSSTVNKGWDGSTETVEKESTVVDPKGLNNKLDASAQHERVDQQDGDYKQKDKINHADGTYEERGKTQSTKEHLLDDGKTITTKTTKIVDPEGLGNKEKTEVEEKVVQNPDGTTSKSVSETQTHH